MCPRLARLCDLPALRALHEENWRGAYAGLLPKAAFGAPLARYMTAKWTPGLIAAHRVYVCGDAETLRGFAVVEPGADQDAKQGLFLDNLHVAEAERGRGVGRALMAAVAARAGAGPVSLVVLAANDLARAQYRRWGGQEDRPRWASLMGHHVLECRVHWASGSALAQALGAASCRL